MSQELLGESIHVTFVHSIDEMRIQRPGDPNVEIVQLGSSQAERFSGALAAMYINSGQGAHVTGDVQRNSGLSPNSFRPSLGVIEKFVPGDVAQVIPPSEHFPTGRVYFGDLAISSMRPTQEDRDNAAERRRSEQIGEHLEMLTYDHAIVTLPSGDYYMPLDSLQAVLGLRVLHALSAYSDDRLRHHIGAGPMAQEIWAQMPLAERELFTDDPLRLGGKGQFMERAVDAILSGMAAPLGLVRRSTTSRTMLLQNRIDTQLVLSSPSQEFLDQDPRTISVSEIAFTSEVRNTFDLDQTIVEKMTVAAPEVLALDLEAVLARYPRGVDDDGEKHRIAGRVLDVVMLREGKEVIRGLLGGEEVTNEQLDAELERLHDVAMRLFGSLDTYYLEKRGRTISGWVSTAGTHRVQFRSSLNPARTRWSTGLLSDKQALLDQPSTVHPRIGQNKDE